MPSALTLAAISGGFSVSLAMLLVTVAALLFAAHNETYYLLLQCYLFVGTLGVTCFGAVLIFFRPAMLTLCTVADTTKILS